MTFWQKILSGAAVGAVGALKADHDASTKSPDAWDWKIAANRAGQGAVVGAGAALLAELGLGS